MQRLVDSNSFNRVFIQQLRYKIDTGRWYTFSERSMAEVWVFLPDLLEGLFAVVWLKRQLFGDYTIENHSKSP